MSTVSIVSTVNMANSTLEMACPIVGSVLAGSIANTKEFIPGTLGLRPLSSSQKV